jgi:hypothetical protein
MSSKAETWLRYYSSLERNQAVNLQMAQIMAFNRFQMVQDDYVSNLKSSPGLALLVVNGFHELLLFHNIHYHQQNLFCIESKLLGLLGGGEKADCYRIDPISASQDLEFNAPLWRDLKGASDAAAVSALQVPDQNPAVYRGKASIIVPPLVLTTILEAELHSAKFQEFDHTSPTVKACTILRPVLEFLWAAHNKMVLPLVMSVERNQNSLDWYTNMHSAHITPSIQELPPPFLAPPPPQDLTNYPALNSMAGYLRILRDGTDHLNLIKASNEEQKKMTGGWDKIPEVVQKMIIRLSAITDGVLPPGPCDSYLRVLKQSKALGVAMVLNIELSIRGCQVDVPTPMANAIKTGNFRANSLLVAHPFSIFDVPYIDAANLPSCNNKELDLLQTEGEGIPKEMVKKLAENKFKHPDSTYHLRHQFNNWYGILQICFGENSLLSKEARAWILHVDKHETSYNACFKSDSDFGAKLLGLIDLMFFQLCESCLRATEFKDVDYSQLALQNKRFDILQNCFQANKPAYLTAPFKRSREADDEGSSDDAKGGKKKQKNQKDEKDKFQYKDLGLMIINPAPVQDWKITGFKYKQIFTKDTTASTPHFNSSGITMKNATDKLLINLLSQLPIKLPIING